MEKPEEFYSLVPILNEFPLDCLIIHPRVGKQMYDGKINHESLQNYLPLIKHDIVYNGDIFTYNDYITIRERYPSITSWMIGRGVFYNPLLPSRIKNMIIPDDQANRNDFLAFLLGLYNELQHGRKKEKVIDKIKDLWKFFCMRFTDPQSVFERIAHTHSLEEIVNETKKISEKESIKYQE